MNYTQSFIARAKSFMNDLLLAGGMIKNDKNTSGRTVNYIARNWKKEAETICNELLHKKFKFADVDNALSTIAKSSGRLATISLDNTRTFTVDNAEILADYIAWFCKHVNNIWDDTKIPPATMEQLKKYTIFGKALADAHLFKSTPEPETQQSNVNSKTGNPPKNDYKSRGPQSMNARGLIGTPGQKETLNGGNAYVYVCEFDKKGANFPYLFVDPITKKGDAGNNINHVIAGSANGYTDCRCYFATRAEADAFLAQFVKLYSAQARTTSTGTTVYDYGKYTGLCVKYARNMPGFYKVKTNCGDCYINAKMLNEEIEENLTEAKKEIPADVANKVEQAAKVYKTYDIYDIDVYEEAFNRYL